MSSRFIWDRNKNETLKRDRGVSFDEISVALQGSDLLDDVDHPNRSKYPGQRMFEVKVRGYVYLVPYREMKEHVVLITIIPSRKAKSKYLEGGV